MRSGLIPSDGFFDHSRRRGRAVALRLGRVVDYLFGALYLLLGVRFALEFFGARPEAGFVRLVRRWSDAFYDPFRGIFPTSTANGGQVVWSLLVAILAYMVLHAAIRGLMNLFARG